MKSADRQPGRRDVPIELQRKESRSTVPFSESVDRWKSYGQAWAHVRPLYARERETALKFEGTITHILEVDHHPELEKVLHTDRIRVIETERIFNIGGVIDENERGRELRIFVTENLDSQGASDGAS